MTVAGMVATLTIAAFLIATGVVGLRSGGQVDTRRPVLVVLALVGDAAHVVCLLGGAALVIVAIAQPLGGHA